jgi:endoglucanase
MITSAPRRASLTFVVAAAAALVLAALSTSLGQGAPAVKKTPGLGRGVNILGYDGLWEGGVNAPFRQQNFQLIRDAGFDHVRINLHAFKHMNVNNELDPKVMDRLDWVLEQVSISHLIPVVDEHDFHSCQRDPDDCGVKLLAFWKQVSRRFAGKYPAALFELLNEPGGRMAQAWWNGFIPVVMKVIRENDPGRVVVVAAINSDDPLQIRELRLPANDRNIIVTVHYYKPIQFTHQGAPWSAKFAMLHDIGWGSSADEQQVRDDFELIDAWARAEGRPLYLGEFGVYERANIEARRHYMSFVARSAERLGWAWAYWQFDHDFALFDTTKQRWNCPLLDALVPHGCERGRNR